MKRGGAVKGAASTGLTVNVTSADALLGTFTLLVELAGAPEPWTLTKRYSDFHFFHDKLPEAVRRMMGTDFPGGQAPGAASDELRSALGQWMAEFVAMPMTPATRSHTLTFLHARLRGAPADAARKLTGGIIKTGYLTKLGGNKSGAQGNWKKRFMVLTDELHYYEDEASYLNGRPPKGTVKLDTIYCPTPDPTDDALTLYALPYEFTCKADTPEEMQEWIEVFQALPSL